MTRASNAGCAGALLIHPLLFLIAFAKGALFGHPQSMFISSGSPHGPVEGGLAGGMNVAEELLIDYLVTMGIAPIICSLGGVGLALMLTSLTARKRAIRH